MIKFSTFPETTPDTWHHEFLPGFTPVFANGFWCYAYGVWASRDAKDGGDPAFSLESHKSQLRVDHQEIITRIDAQGRNCMEHVSGLLVPGEQLDDFLKRDSAAYRWERPWTDDKGRSLLPFMMPTYRASVGIAPAEIEALDPQWKRRRLNVPLDGQIQDCIQRRLGVIFQQKLSGDHRGTTLNLQVGANVDDITHYVANDLSHQYETINYLLGGGRDTDTSLNQTGCAARFTNVTIPQAAAIDSAILTVYAWGTHSGTVARATIDAEDVDNGDAPTSDADWDNEVKTTATVACDPVPVIADGAAYSTPESKTVCQELVNRALWATGNAQVYFIHDEANLSDAVGTRRQWQSYVQNTLKAPTCDINYTAGGASLVLPRRTNVLLRR